MGKKYNGGERKMWLVCTECRELFSHCLDEKKGLYQTCKCDHLRLRDVDPNNPHRWIFCTEDELKEFFVTGKDPDYWAVLCQSNESATIQRHNSKKQKSA
jgi:hypothetical protein